MAWDTEGTKRKILLAAVDEFAAHGPDGTTIERIAKAAGVNKERVYNYFGAKRKLFAYVLREEMAKVARAVPIGPFAVDDVGDYAGRVYDYHREHPQLNRLLLWEGLVLGADVPSDDDRLARYREKTSAVAEGQQSGHVTEAIDADHLAFLILSLAGWSPDRSTKTSIGAGGRRWWRPPGAWRRPTAPGVRAAEAAADARPASDLRLEPFSAAKRAGRPPLPPTASNLRLPADVA